MICTKRAALRTGLAVAVLALLVSGFSFGCKGPQGDAKNTESQLPSITPVEGMKYYVGGPVMKYDSYGRLRLGGFNGEVATPVSRGLLLGYKLEPDGPTSDIGHGSTAVRSRTRSDFWMRRACCGSRIEKPTTARGRESVGLR